MARELTESEMLVLLSERRRRLTMRIVQESAPPLSTREIATAIGHREFVRPSTDDLDSIRLSLHHNHLPRLHSAEVLVYERETGTVTPAVNFDSLLRLLSQTGDDDLPWADGITV